MSTRSDPPVYLEFPNFGYGPASALLALVDPIIDAYAWHIVSTGGAAEFARRHLPNAVVHDIDTFSRNDWPAVLDVVPPESVIISAINPQFAGWAAQHSYRIGIVDTLDWMWDTQSPGVGDVELHLVQRYFGSRKGACGPTGRRQPIRPIVDLPLWAPGVVACQPGTAVVGFGGMSVPGRDHGTGQYVSWLLSAAVPLLVEYAHCSRVTVVGARSDIAELVPELWASHPAIDIRAGLDRASYARLVRASEHLVLAPGLASLHECATAELAPLVQPGFSMSMVLQAGDLVETGYPHVAAWPWLEDAVPELTGMAELDGLRYLADLIDSTVLATDPDKSGITKALLSYIDRDPATRLNLTIGTDLPDGRELLDGYLRTCQQ